MRADEWLEMEMGIDGAIAEAENKRPERLCYRGGGNEIAKWVLNNPGGLDPQPGLLFTGSDVVDATEARGLANWILETCPKENDND